MDATPSADAPRASWLPLETKSPNLRGRGSKTSAGAAGAAKSAASEARPRPADATREQSTASGPLRAGGEEGAKVRCWVPRNRGSIPFAAGTEPQRTASRATTPAAPPAPFRATTRGRIQALHGVDYVRATQGPQACMGEKMCCHFDHGAGERFFGCSEEGRAAAAQRCASRRRGIYGAGWGLLVGRGQVRAVEPAPARGRRLPGCRARPAAHTCFGAGFPPKSTSF